MRKQFFDVVVGILALVCVSSVVQAHNLDQQMTFVAFDNETADRLADRANADSPFFAQNDVIGLIFKTTPGPGTPVGVGGYMDFYIPEGTQVMGVEYLSPDLQGSFEFDAVPIKGQADIGVGLGDKAAQTTPGLIGLSLGPNLNGQTELAVTSSGGVDRGTLSGVYADTGFFYSSDPRTVRGSYVGPLIQNNDKDWVMPLHQWDASQLRAYGLQNGLSLIDTADGRGNAPWGLANGVAGPQSGYAWEFNGTYWDGNASDGSQRMKNSIQIGPWNRIKYPGSQSAFDIPGNTSRTLGYAGIDASDVGSDLPLPPTFSHSDSSSPKTIRVSYGSLELNRPEYCRIYVKLLPGFPVPDDDFDFNAAAFGGDAAGVYAGKDHLWRYYKPSERVAEFRALLTKKASKPFIGVNESVEFSLRYYNIGSNTLSNLVINDPLPSGLVYDSAVTPSVLVAGSQAGSVTHSFTSGSSTRSWTFPTVPARTVITIKFNVKAQTTGTKVNTASAVSDQFETQASETVEVGVTPIFQGSKSVTPSELNVGGGTVDYTVVVENNGSGNSSVPLVVDDFLPEGFTFASLLSATTSLGGPVTLSVSDRKPGVPSFTLNQALPAGESLQFTFTASVDPSLPEGIYCNTARISSGSRSVGIPSSACVTLLGTGGKVGDRVWLDSNGNGIQDTGELGRPGILVRIYEDANTNGIYEAGSDPLVAGKTTDTSGGYLFTGLPSTNYLIEVVPDAGYDFVQADQGGDDAVDSDVNPATGFSEGFFLPETGDIRTMDAGMICAAPVIACPADTSVECSVDPDPNLTGFPSATSACACSISYTYEDNLTSSCGNAGVIARAWTASDDCGASSIICTQLITLVDTLAPELIGVPADAVVECDALSSLPGPTAVDLCDDGPDLVLSVVTNSGTCAYTLVRVWTATDACNNSQSATQTVTVVDTTAPVLSGVPADVTVDASSIPTVPTVTATDACDDSIDVTLSVATNAITCPNGYTLTRVWTAEDDCNNSVSATQVVSVVELDLQALAIGKVSDALGDITGDGQVVTYTISVTNTDDTCTIYGVNITDILPEEVTYVENSTVLTAMMNVEYTAVGDSGDVADSFASKDYDRDDGTDSWLGDWNETNDDNKDDKGSIKIDKGWLRLAEKRDKVASIERAVDLSGSWDQVSLRFDYKTSWNLEASDNITLQVSTNSGNSWIDLESFTDDPPSETEHVEDLTAYQTADTLIRFREQLSGSGEYFYIDNVTIAYLRNGEVSIVRELVSTNSSANTTLAEGLELRPSEIATVSLQVVTPNPLVAGVLTNQACATGIHQTPICASVTDVMSPVPNPDLALSMTADVLAPLQADTVVFTLVVTNVGNRAFSSVSVSDLLPTDLAFVSASPSAGSYDSVTGVWTIPSGIGLYGSATLELETSVLQDCAPIENIATLAASVPVDLNGANDTASVLITPVQPITDRRVEDGLVGYWPMTAGSGSVLEEQSGHGISPDLYIYSGSVSWLSGRNGISITANALISSIGPAKDLSESVEDDSKVFSIEVWASPANQTQTGPASLVSLSEDPSHRNFTLGQTEQAVEFRVRRDKSASSGTPGYTVDNVFGGDANPHHYVATFSRYGKVVIYVDGQKRGETDWRKEIRGKWSDHAYLMLANEINKSSPWLGELYMVAMYNKTLTASDVGKNFLAGSNPALWEDGVSLEVDGPKNACEQDLVSFSVATPQVGAEYQWSFGTQAEPQTATGPGPHTVAYQSQGLKDIVLDNIRDCKDPVTSYIDISCPPPGLCEDACGDSDLLNTTLWGLDSAAGRLFALQDYNNPTTSFVDHGELVWDDNGTLRPLEGHLEAFDIGPDGTIYMAYNHDLGNVPEPVLVTYQIGDSLPGEQNSVTVVGTINIPFDHPEDRVVGLSLSPETGRMMALLQNNDSRATDRLYEIDPQTGDILSAFGGISGTVGGVKKRVRTAADIEFIAGGRLLVTDNRNDNLYELDPESGKIIGLIDDSEDAGVSGTGLNIEALAYDFVSDKLLFSDAQLSVFGQLSLEVGNNSTIGDLGSSPISLSDVRGLDFVPVVNYSSVSISWPADQVAQCPYDGVPTEQPVILGAICDLTVEYTNHITQSECSTLIERVWTVADACGRTQTATQTIEVIDTLAPLLSGVPSDLTVECDEIPLVAEVTAVDACAGAIQVDVSGDVLSGPCDNSFTLIRVWSADDGCGNIAVATQRIDVIDTVAPVLSEMPADETVDCASIPDLPVITAFDSCTGPGLLVSLTQSVSQVSCTGSYLLTRAWSASDPCGNTTNYAQVLTVRDTTGPVLNGVPADYTASCEEDLSTLGHGVTAVDACDGTTAVVVVDTVLPGGCDNSYTVSRVWSSVDDCQNLTQQTQTIAVVDLDKPILSGVPASLVIECSEPIPPNTASVVATDACDPSVEVIYAQTIATNTCGGNVTVTRSWTATDDCGNIASDVQTITVVDTLAPVLVGVPANLQVDCAIIPEQANVTAVDNCDDSPDVTFSEVTVPLGCPGQYEIVRTWTATDDCDNYTSASQTILVFDETGPVLSGVPADVTLECSDPVLAIDLVPVSAEDECEGVIVVSASEITVPGNCPNQYDFVRTWSAVDSCGNLTEESQTISLIDTTAPTLVCIDDLEMGEGDPLPAFEPLVEDNCDPSAGVTVQSPTEGSVLPLGTNLVSLTAGDACGNTTNCSFNVIVRPKATIGDLIWWDGFLFDEDGVFDPGASFGGDPGEPDIQVNLYDASTNYLTNTFSDESGAYEFKVDKGQYLIQFVLPDPLVLGFVYGFAPYQAGSDPSIDSDADETTGFAPMIDVDWGEVRDDIDAGVIDLDGIPE